MRGWFSWHRYQAQEGQYREQIKSLTPAVPMALPPIKPLVAIVSPLKRKPKSNLEPFRKAKR